jgi:beta-glucosidase
MYDANNVQPAFAFGHGLSYTSFKYSGLTFDTPSLTATFTIKNTGSIYGAEIAQLYLGFPADAGEPPKVLRGFRKVTPSIFCTNGVLRELRRIRSSSLLARIAW